MIRKIINFPAAVFFSLAVMVSWVDAATVTVTAVNGTATLDPAGGSYEYGTEITITVSPGIDSFATWSDDTTGTMYSFTKTVTSDLNYTVTFSPSPTYTGGATTVGTGGVYGTLKSFKRKLGNLSSNGVITQLSDLVMDTAMTISSNIGAYSLTWNGMGYFQTLTASSITGWDIRGTSNGGSWIFDGVRFKMNTGLTLAGQAFISTFSHSGAMYLWVRRCSFYADPTKSIYPINIADSETRLKVSNCVFASFKNRANINFSTVDSVKVENCSFYQPLRGVDCNSLTRPISIRNCVFIGAIDGGVYASGTNTVVTTCASDGTTVPDSTMRSLPPLKMVLDTVPGNAGFMVTSDTGMLYLRGSEPTLQSDTIHFNQSVAGIAAGVTYPTANRYEWPRIAHLWDSISWGQGFVTGEKYSTLTASHRAFPGDTTIRSVVTDSFAQNQLVVYKTRAGWYRTAVIKTIYDDSIVLKTGIVDTVDSGNNVFSCYANDSHFGTAGFTAIADYLYRFFENKPVADISVAGDSWAANGTIESRLQTLLPGWTIHNEGIGGSSAASTLARYDDSIAPNNSDYVVLLVGTNDWSAGTTAPVFNGTIMSLINKIRLNGAVPIILTSSVGPEGNSTQKTLSRMFAKYTKETWGGINNAPFTVGANGARETEPMFYRHPSSLTVSAATVCTLVVKSTGYPTIAYQWQIKHAAGSWVDTAITSDTLIKTVVAGTDSVRCKSANSLGADTSDAVQIKGTATYYLSYTITGGNASVTFLGDSIAAYGETVRAYLNVNAGYRATWPGGTLVSGNDTIDVVMTKDSTMVIVVFSVPLVDSIRPGPKANRNDSCTAKGVRFTTGGKIRNLTAGVDAVQKSWSATQIDFYTASTWPRGWNTLVFTNSDSLRDTGAVYITIPRKTN